MSPGTGPPPPAEQDWIDEPAPPWWRSGRLLERWLPGAGPPRRRLSLGLLAGLALVLVTGAGVALSSGAEPEAPPNLPVARAASEPVPPSSAGSAATSIVVSVVGRVERPGLVTLTDGARVADALRAAGGPAPGVDISGLNIARRLTDGEQIYVGVPAPPEAAAPGAAPPGRIDLNAATTTQLDTLPGVGTVTAQRIVDWRTKHGRFTRIEQLREIEGIGPARFAQLRDLVVVQ